MYRGVAFIVRDSLATLRDPASITALAPNESDIHLSCKGTVDKSQRHGNCPSCQEV